MRNYELVFIVHPEADEVGLSSVIDRVSHLIEREGGKITKTDPWGLRRLAYPIQKQREGYYVLMLCELDPQAVVTLERSLGLTDHVMRHLVVRREESVKAPAPAVP